jgi:hypothetical protein
MSSKTVNGGGNYSFGGSGGGNQSGTSGSMIGGGQVPLTGAGSNVSVYITFSGPLALAIESGAAAKGTAPKNGYQPTDGSILALGGKVAGFGGKIDIYYDREKGLSLDLDLSAILGGTATYNRDDGWSTNGYASLNTGVGVGFLGMGLGAGVASAYDDGYGSLGGYYDMGLIGVKGEYGESYPLFEPLNTRSRFIDVIRGAGAGPFDPYAVPNEYFNPLDDARVNGPQIGGTNAVEMLQAMMRNSNFNPALGPNPFEDRGGPSGPNSQPYNPLTDSTNTELRNLGNGGSGGGNPNTSHFNTSQAGGGPNGPGGPLAPSTSPTVNQLSGDGHHNAQPREADGGDSFGDHSSPSGGGVTGGGTGVTSTTNPGHGGPSAGSGPGDTSSPRTPTTTPKPVDTSKFDTTKNGGGLFGPGGIFGPVILDIAGTGIAINELTNSNKFLDAEGTGLLHRTAWAGVGSGVLFYDAGNDGAITEKREYVFTEWDPTARGDLEAIRSVFDTNGDGVLTQSDTDFSKFKVEITNADGTTSVQSLTQLGITSINLKGDLTNIQYTDGSAITGQTTFTRSNGTTGTVANAVLAAEATGYAITTTSTVDGSGIRTTTNTAIAADGSIASVTKTVTTATGGSVTTSFDNNGDGVYDRVQTKLTSTTELR